MKRPSYHRMGYPTSWHTRQAQQALEEAYAHLRDARDLLAYAGAGKTLARVRLAVSSIKGARRNARGRVHRIERNERK